jgi:hypothetical protein
MATAVLAMLILVDAFLGLIAVPLALHAAFARRPLPASDRPHAARTSAQPALVAGVLAGLAGLLAFLVAHHLWIRPIWFILPLGLLVAAGGGLLAGWAYAELRPRLPRQPWTSLAWAALVGLPLLPAVALAELRPPVFVEAAGGAVLTVSVARVLFIFLVELLLAAAVVGALTGWLVGRTRRAALAMALAGLVFALGPGHNVPFLGSTAAAGKGLALLALVVVVAAVVQVEAHRGLLPRWPK